MARAKVIAIDTSGPEPLYTVEMPDGSKRTGLTGAQLKPAGATGGDKAAAAPAPPAEVKFFAYELDGGIVTINEVRASKGLPRDARFGDMTLPEYRAANPEMFKAPAAAQTQAALARTEDDVTKEEMRAELAQFRAGMLSDIGLARQAGAPAQPPLSLSLPGASVTMSGPIHLDAVNVDGAAAVADAITKGGAAVAKAIDGKLIPASQPPDIKVMVSPEVVAKVDLKLPEPRERMATVETDADGTQRIKISGGQ